MSKSKSKFDISLEDKKFIRGFRDSLKEIVMTNDKNKNEVESKKSKSKDKSKSKSKSKTNSDAYNMELQSIQTKVSLFEQELDFIWPYFCIYNNLDSIFKIPLERAEKIKMLKKTENYTIDYETHFVNLLKQNKIIIKEDSLDMTIDSKIGDIVTTNVRLWILIIWKFLSNTKEIDFFVFLKKIEDIAITLKEKAKAKLFDNIYFPMIELIRDKTNQQLLKCDFFTNLNPKIEVFELYNDLPDFLQKIIETTKSLVVSKEEGIKLKNFNNLEAKVIESNYKLNGNFAVLEPINEVSDSSNNINQNRKSIIITHLNKIPNKRFSANEDLQELMTKYEGNIDYYPYDEDLIKSIKK